MGDMAQRQHLLFLGLLLLTLAGVACSRSGQAGAPNGSVKPVALQEKIPSTFTFVAFGDTRFHDPSDTGPANPAVRHALVAAFE